MDIIEFQKKKFPTREIELPEFGDVLVSTHALNKSLVNPNGGYISEEAQRVDEKVFYFVDEDEINLKDKDLINLVFKQLI